MRLPSPLTRLAAATLFGGALAVLPLTVISSRPAAAQSTCEQELPAATDGTLTLDRSTVQPGDDIVGLLTGFQQWPVGLIGGGSGETFLSCTPWAPQGRAVVIRQGAPFALLSVPATAKPGTYSVSVVFYEGATQPVGGNGQPVRLTAPIKVVAATVPGAGATSPACQTQASAAPVGQLVAAGPARPGRALTVSLRGVDPSSLTTLNEYDQLWFMACIGGLATPVAHRADPPAAFAVVVPRGLETGTYSLRVIGVLDDAVVAWELPVAVVKPSVAVLPGTGADSHGLVLAGMVAVALGGFALAVARQK